MNPKEKVHIRIVPFEETSVQRKFTIIFLIISIIPMVLLYYVYLKNTGIGYVNIPTTGFTIAMNFMVIGVLVGYFFIRSLLVKINDISNKNRKAIEPFLSPEVINELGHGENEIVVLGRSFSAVIKQLEKDINELREKNEKLKSLDQLKDDFVSNVSHELRTPLTIIQESISQVSEGMYGSPNEQQLKYLNMSLKNVERLRELIDNLLDLSKMEKGRLEIVKKNVDLVEIVKEVISDFMPKIQKKGLEIRCNCPAKKVEVFADKAKIIQVLFNLLSNACKFTDKGHIEISVKQTDRLVECGVADTGLGITPENLPNLFSKFYQVRQQISPKEKGTGLGLVICKNIVELHNGKIFVESIKSKGTKFTFTLPKGDINEENINSR